MTVSHEQVTADQVLSMAEQMSNSGSQPQQQEGQDQEQRVPYDRFKEVNDERKTLQEQNSKLMEMMQAYQNMQQNQQASQQEQQVQQSVANQPVNQPLFTEAELDSFETDIVLDPKSTLQKFGEAILERGVNSRVQSLEQSFEQKLAQMQNQLIAQQAPSVIDNFKRSRFSPTDTAEIAAFDQALQGMDPSMLANPQTLENVRLAAIGYVADQKRSQPQHNQQAFFTETPGGMNTGWGGLGVPAQPQIPQGMIDAARKMGVDPQEAANLYSAMDRSGVFR